MYLPGMEAPVKVQELIDRLKKMPSDATVVARAGKYGEAEVTVVEAGTWDRNAGFQIDEWYDPNPTGHNSVPTGVYLH